MKKHYHLYMDEAGQFEGTSQRVAVDHDKQPLIFGLLVPDSERTELEAKFKEIANNNSMEGFIHATGIHHRKKFPPFANALVAALEKSSMIPFVLRYESDLLSELPDAARDAYAANRHLNMAQAAFEYLLFLQPKFWGNNITIDFHPNSRVVPVKKGGDPDIFRNMGFDVCSRGVDFYVPVWTTGTIRAYLHRMLIDYSPWTHKTGERAWPRVEAIVASRSDDPFVHWTDILAWIARWGDNSPKHSDITRRLRSITKVSLLYGREHSNYRDLARLYLDGDMESFLPTAMSTLPTLKHSCYRENLACMLDSFITGATSLDEKQLANLERLAAEYLETSRGNWDFVLRLLSCLVKAIDSLPKKERESREIHRLLFRLHSHLIRIYNHRGDAGRAWQSYGIIERLDVTPATVDEFLEKTELINRLAVSAANVFAFEKSNHELKPLTKALESSREPLNKANASELAFPLLGKLWGTMGQNYAFLAPRKHEYFPEAENMFLKARDSFALPHERLRHEVNLLHLYLDWERTNAEKQNLADAAAKRIKKSPAMAAFLAKPGPATAPYNQFNLAAIIKHSCQRNIDIRDLTDRYQLDFLKRWFGVAANEHPFEFICGWLGLGALQIGKRKEGIAFLNHALTIPGADKPEEEPTLQVLRCQIVARWVLIEKDLDSKTDVSNKMKVITNVLGHIGNTIGLETMLRLKDNEEPTGWFAPTWSALSTVDWEHEFNQEPCETFLACFTFNYR